MQSVFRFPVQMVVFGVSCFLLSLPTGSAQDPMRVERIRVIPENIPILNIYVDDDNVKWVANTKSLYRVDAKDQAVQVPIAPGEVSLLQFPGGNADIRWSEDVMAGILGPAKITAAAYDNALKTLWIGTNGYGVFKFKTDPNLRLVEQLHIDNSKLRSDFINSIYVSKSGKVWIATEDGAVSVVGNQWTIHQKFFNIQRIRGHSTELWAIGDDLIWIIDAKDNWTPIEINRRQIEGEIHDIAVDKEGRVWIASNIMTSYRITSDYYQHFGPGQYFTSQFVNYVSVDDDGTIWVGTNDKGLYIIIKESTITVTSKIDKYLDCNGSSKNAAFTVRAIGGKPPYQFVWSNGASGDHLTDLGPGKYQLTVTDTEGSSKVAVVDVPDPSIQLSAVMDRPESDAGIGDGAASVSVTGGAPPYSYEWFSGLGEASITGLSEGSYGITVTDAAGCSAITSVDITRVVKPLAVSLEQKEFIRCAGTSGAVVAARISGGKAPFTYAWSGGLPSQEFQEGLAVGSYSVTVTDTLDNSAMASIAIKEPEALSAIVHIESPASTNQNNGVASVECKGGKPPYVYEWDNGESGTIAKTLAPRRHTITVTDGAGCTTVAAVDISENVSPLKATITQTSGIRCAGEQTGSLTVEVQGGKSPFQYQWNNPALKGAEISGLSGGAYAVTVSDAAHNSAVLSSEIAEPSPIRATTIAETPALSGKNEGHAVVRAEGGTGKLSAKWDNGDEGTKTVSLTAGIHTVTVTDASGCSLEAQVEIVEDFLPLTVVLEQTGEIRCAGQNTGAINATVSGGKAPYVMAWDHGLGNSEQPKDLAAGTYKLQVTDAGGNAVTKEISLAEPPPLRATIDVLNSATANNADGSARINALGGVPPLEIKWPNGENTALVKTLAAGRYPVTVTDANGCSTIAAVEITENILPLAVQINQTAEVLCSGGKTAAAEVSIKGGKSPFTFAWDDGADTQQRSALGAGHYAVTVTDASGLKSTAALVISEPGPLSGIIGDTRAATHERIHDGKATAHINGGVTPYAFAWDDGESMARATQLSVGTHAVTVTDAHGCTIQLDTEITEKILPELTAENLEKGEAVRMEKLQFEADSSSIDSSSIPTLEELYQFLYDNPTIVVEIGGHTNGLPDDAYCDKLSTARAKAVADYIIQKGIDPKRIIYKGYGKRQPIATNMTPEGRRRNQRVEVKIVRLSE